MHCAPYCVYRAAVEAASYICLHWAARVSRGPAAAAYEVNLFHEGRREDLRTVLHRSEFCGWTDLGHAPLDKPKSEWGRGALPCGTSSMLQNSMYRRYLQVEDLAWTSTRKGLGPTAQCSDTALLVERHAK